MFDPSSNDTVKWPYQLALQLPGGDETFTLFNDKETILEIGSIDVVVQYTTSSYPVGAYLDARIDNCMFWSPVPVEEDGTHVDTFRFEFHFTGPRWLLPSETLTIQVTGIDTATIGVNYLVEGYWWTLALSPGL